MLRRRRIPDPCPLAGAFVPPSLSPSPLRRPPRASLSRSPPPPLRRSPRAVLSSPSATSPSRCHTRPLRRDADRGLARTRRRHIWSLSAPASPMLCVSPVSTSLQRRGSRHLPSPPRLPDERPTVRRLRAHGVSKLTSGLRAHWAPSASQRSVAPQREAHGPPAPGVRRLQAPPPPPLPHSAAFQLF
ncbi:hypothetical protein PVAP13_1KG120900 [Panicum virgatum]|uniref:Uncharacterized protein n=1 Tax=Panicum virgatum TaxID=38727 RepID=A0A8T0XA30_PANVG|nr:hypothetical protein PVAP13_1KG120900 [Panicum virgatum]